jgi:pSer/pThr/pTyr-binding forkhead associated (FHA) protein
MSHHFSDGFPSPSQSGQYSGTSLEPVDDIRAAAKSGYTPTIKPTTGDADTVRFRPLRRPPMAALCVLFDGRDEGEWVPIRGDKIVIGRTDGDVLIPHDSAMSSRHAEIVRRADGGSYRWYLSDLQSSNGTFVRVGRSVLKHGDELLIGGGRYRFNAGPAAAAQTATPDEVTQGTQRWPTVRTSDMLPSVERLSSSGDGQVHLIHGNEAWVGRDSSHCSIVLTDDLMVSPRHARLYRDGKGRWVAENAGALNGTWLRVQTMPIDSTGQFQLGEQRFLLRPLS